MAGPKRGIEMRASVLIACFIELASLDRRVYTQRIEGDVGAVEATIQVGTSQMHHNSGLDLSLSCHVSLMPPKIELFQGVIAEPCDLNKFVVAVVRGSALVVYLTVDLIGGSDRARPCYAFRAKAHGHDVQEFKLDFANILGKVSWSTLVPFRIAHGLL